jgi:hypothetical protein
VVIYVRRDWSCRNPTEEQGLISEALDRMRPALEPAGLASWTLLRSGYDDKCFSTHSWEEWKDPTLHWPAVVARYYVPPHVLIDEADIRRRLTAAMWGALRWVCTSMGGW